VSISRTAYWRRSKPPRAYDIAMLRPPSMPRSQRFETVEDAVNESIRSETVLRNAAAPSHLADYLSECRAGDYVCEQTFCPGCARRFRRWFIGEILQIIQAKSEPAHIVTVLLAKAGRYQGARSRAIPTLTAQAARPRRPRRRGCGWRL
jgi:hypothetical protein